MNTEESGNNKLSVLCVDDDAAVREGLELSLRQRYAVSVADSGEQALAMLAGHPVAILISDMRMPGMDGATLLASVRQRYPETVRLLLTGYADVTAAASAVNDGQVFRFLVKPCPPPTVQRALADAATQYRLQTVERSLLERTLRGAVQALTGVLSLTDPQAYSRATQVQKLALAMAQALKLQPTWALELAAMLGPLGRVSLPPELVQKQMHGEPLNPAERDIIGAATEVTHRLLAPIPRLEPVRDILRESEHRPSTDADGARGTPLQQLARLLRLATQYVDFDARGDSATVALAQMRTRLHPSDAEAMATLENIVGTEAASLQVRVLAPRQLREGMVLCDDLLTQAGQRLVPRGFQVNAGFVERLRNLRHDALRGPVRVLLPREPAA